MDEKYSRYKRYDDDFKRNAVDLVDSTALKPWLQLSH